MIVYHFNTYIDGGASGAVRRLHDSLLKLGIASRYYHSPWISANPDAGYFQFEHEPIDLRLLGKLADRLNGKYRFRKEYQDHLDHYLTGRPEGYECFSFCRLPVETPLRLNGDRPDIIHMHWVSGLLDYPSFFASLPDDIPIVWTLHDMNPFTGGCHYSADCSKYKEQCGECPQLNANRSPSDLSSQNFQIKAASIKNKTLHIVADSKWLEQRSRESRLFSRAKSFQTIHYGVSSKLFHSKNKLSCREALGIDAKTFVLCFGAASIENPRKGLTKLFEALTHLPDMEITLLLFGEGKAQTIQGLNHVRLKYVGKIESPELLSIVYSAADVFVIPSLEEAFGQTALESMACETPVAGFRVGGIPDAVRHGVNGLLADPGNAVELAGQIRYLAQHPEERTRMGRVSREIAQKEFTLEMQAESYAALYKSLVK